MKTLVIVMVCFIFGWQIFTTIWFFYLLEALERRVGKLEAKIAPKSDTE